jgi:dihydroorotase
LLESFGAIDQLEGFVSAHGRRFYKVPAQSGQELRLRKTEDGGRVPGVITGQGVEVVPFFAGKTLGWEIV